MEGSEDREERLGAPESGKVYWWERVGIVALVHFVVLAELMREGICLEKKLVEKGGDMPLVEDVRTAIWWMVHILFSPEQQVEEKLKGLNELVLGAMAILLVPANSILWGVVLVLLWEVARRRRRAGEVEVRREEGLWKAVVWMLIGYLLLSVAGAVVWGGVRWYGGEEMPGVSFVFMPWSLLFVCLYLWSEFGGKGAGRLCVAMVVLIGLEVLKAMAAAADVVWMYSMLWVMGVVVVVIGLRWVLRKVG